MHNILTKIFGKKKEKDTKPSFLPPFDLIMGNRHSEMGYSTHEWSFFVLTPNNWIQSVINKVIITLPEETYSPFHIVTLDKAPYELAPRVFDGEELTVNVELFLTDNRVLKFPFEIILDDEGILLNYRLDDYGLQKADQIGKKEKRSTIMRRNTITLHKLEEDIGKDMGYISTFKMATPVPSGKGKSGTVMDLFKKEGENGSTSPKTSPRTNSPIEKKTKKVKPSQDKTSLRESSGNHSKTVSIIRKKESTVKPEEEGKRDSSRKLSSSSLNPKSSMSKEYQEFQKSSAELLNTNLELVPLTEDQTSKIMKQIEQVDVNIHKLITSKIEMVNSQPKKKQSTNFTRDDRILLIDESIKELEGNRLKLQRLLEKSKKISTSMELSDEDSKHPVPPHLRRYTVGGLTKRQTQTLGAPLNKVPLNMSDTKIDINSTNSPPNLPPKIKKSSVVIPSKTGDTSPSKTGDTSPSKTKEISPRTSPRETSPKSTPESSPRNETSPTTKHESPGVEVKVVEPPKKSVAKVFLTNPPILPPKLDLNIIRVKAKKRKKVGPARITKVPITKSKDNDQDIFHEKMAEPSEEIFYSGSLTDRPSTKTKSELGVDANENGDNSSAISFLMERSSESLSNFPLIGVKSINKEPSFPSVIDKNMRYSVSIINAEKTLRNVNDLHNQEIENELKVSKVTIEKLEQQSKVHNEQINTLGEENTNLKKKIMELQISEESIGKKKTEIVDLLKEAELKNISLQNSLQKSHEQVSLLEEDKKSLSLLLEASNGRNKELEVKVENMVSNTQELIEQNKKSEEETFMLKQEKKELTFNLKVEKENTLKVENALEENNKIFLAKMSEKDLEIKKLKAEIEKLKVEMQQKQTVVVTPTLINVTPEKPTQTIVVISKPPTPTITPKIQLEAEVVEDVEEDLSFLETGGHPKIDYFDLLDYSTARTVRKDSQAAKYLSQNMFTEEGLLENMLKTVLIPSASTLTRHAMKSDEIVKKMMFICITYLSCDLNHLGDVDKTDKKPNIQKVVTALFNGDLVKICFLFLKEKRDDKLSSIQFASWQLLMELFLIYEREKTLNLVKDHFLLFFDQLYYDEVAVIVNSFLNSEVGSPSIYWSKNEDIIPNLLDKLYCPPNSTLDQYKMSGNSFSILEKIIASSNHNHLQDGILIHIKQFYEIAFGDTCNYEGYDNHNSKYKYFSRISFCYCLKLLGNLSVITLGGYREIEEQLVETYSDILMSHLPIIKEMIKGEESESEDPNLKRIFGLINQNAQVRNGRAFLQIATCSLLGALLTSQNETVEDKLIELELIEDCLSLLFKKERNNILHCSIYDDIVVPVFEDQHEKIIEIMLAKDKFDLLTKLITNYTDFNQPFEPKNLRYNNGSITRITSLFVELELGQDHEEFQNFAENVLPKVNKLLEKTKDLPERPKNTKKDGSLNLSKIQIDVDSSEKFNK
eukprot:TRINITY_DN1080_c0_g2_i1.p1 TRINITY_DN1080_c0_g2~~TRINITY_DN1080_c0_g2_i1.p1  ORF type:complete len:1444 (+),score=509.46 TRINITY_DN1080_c0_g2_i1:61-4392(+)